MRDWTQKEPIGERLRQRPSDRAGHLVVVRTGAGRGLVQLVSDQSLQIVDRRDEVTQAGSHLSEWCQLWSDLAN